MHCHRAALKEPLKDGQGFSLLPGLWPWHKPVGGGRATCIQLWRGGREGWEKNKRPGNETRVCKNSGKWRKYVVVWPNLGPEDWTTPSTAPAEIKKGLQWGCSAGAACPRAAESAGAQPGKKETLCLRARRQNRPSKFRPHCFKVFLMRDYQFSQAPSAIFIHLPLTSAAAN